MIKAILLAAGQSKRLKSENKFKHNLLNIMNFDQCESNFYQIMQ